MDSQSSLTSEDQQHGKDGDLMSGHRESFSSTEFSRGYLAVVTLFEESPSIPDSPVPGGIALGRYYFARLMKWLHEEFASGRLKGRRLLDLCSGTNIHGIMSGSKISDDIIMVDINEHSLTEIKKWLERHPDAHDWSQFFAFVAQKEGGSITAEEVACRVRSAIKQVKRLDLHDDSPGIELLYPVDCVTAILALTSVCEDFDDYRQKLDKIASCLRPGGTLLLVIALNYDHYYVNEKKYHAINLNMNFVLSSLSDAGFREVRCVGYPVPMGDHVTTIHTYVFLSAVYCPTDGQ